MEPLVLYIGEKNVSSWSLRGWLALVHKELPFEERTITLQQDTDRRERRGVGPTGRVPVLHHGRLVIPDSMAIVEYLEETFPPPGHPRLWPEAREERVHARWLSAAMHSGFVKLRESMSFNLCFLPTPPSPTPEARAEAAEMLALWDTALSRPRGSGPFLFGAFCAADIFYAPAIVRLTAFKVPMPAPAARYAEAVLAHPPMRRWMDAARALEPVAEH